MQQTSEHTATDNKAPASPVLNVERSLRDCLFSPFPGIGKLARKHFISQTKLKKDFKVRFNKGIFNYYRQLQMELAECYLNENRYSKGQIAELFNFSNPSNFSSCYRRYLEQKEKLGMLEELTTANDDRYKTLVVQAPFAIAMLDKRLHFIAASQKFIEDYRLTDRHLIGHGLYYIFPKTDENFKKKHREALKGKISNGEDAVDDGGDGSVIWLKWDIRPWRNHDGSIGGILLYTEDITAYRQRAI